MYRDVVLMFLVVLRALGIPARPITTFGSAHDTEANKTIDFYYDKYWNFLEDKSSDSIWYVYLQVFHVCIWKTGNIRCYVYALHGWLHCKFSNIYI